MAITVCRSTRSIGRHHVFVRQAFAQPLDDYDQAELVRIIDRISPGIPGNT